jgi:hypothetical protein
MPVDPIRDFTPDEISAGAPARPGAARAEKARWRSIGKSPAGRRRRVTRPPSLNDPACDRGRTSANA